MFTALTSFSSFSVDDQAKAKLFYTKVLGLEVASEDMVLEFKTPSGDRLFIYEKPNHEPAIYTVFNFVVENIDTAVDELTAQGVTFERYQDLPATQDEKGVLRGLAAGQGPDIAWFKDPAGNILAVLQDK